MIMMMMQCCRLIMLPTGSILLTCKAGITSGLTDICHWTEKEPSLLPL